MSFFLSSIFKSISDWFRNKLPQEDRIKCFVCGKTLSTRSFPPAYMTTSPHIEPVWFSSFFCKNGCCCFRFDRNTNELIWSEFLIGNHIIRHSHLNDPDHLYVFLIKDDQLKDIIRGVANLSTLNPQMLDYHCKLLEIPYVKIPYFSFRKMNAKDIEKKLRLYLLFS